MVADFHKFRSQHGGSAETVTETESEIIQVQTRWELQLTKLLPSL